MVKYMVVAVGLLALGGCAVQTEAQINAGLARHIGQSETDLVREMGVPSRSFDSAGHRFLAYAKGYQTIFPGPGGFGWSVGGPWAYSPWAWGGGVGGYGSGGWGGPSDVVSYGCETTWEIGAGENGAGRVIGVKRHGNDC